MEEQQGRRAKGAMPTAAEEEAGSLHPSRLLSFGFLAIFVLLFLGNICSSQAEAATLFLDRRLLVIVDQYVLQVKIPNP